LSFLICLTLALVCVITNHQLATCLKKGYLVLMPFRKCYITLLAVLLFSIPANAQTVYKTPSGTKYHLASCRMVKNVSEELTIAKAKEMGLDPCKICNPVNSYSTPAVKKAQGENETVQCKGYTKSGTRCRHMTRIANGYCFQHQPK